ncbi:amelotin [Python bivittatus]|uniref:Amelotin n=1 Tax=Python bivittatus TaxID=176946 RepID=A0A9F3VZ48_PYTBI|nr:amelotin [Python bivittatus]
MKIVILLLCLLGLAFSKPVNQAARILATSNSREILRLLQRYRATGNTPQQTQPRPRVVPGLPPAKLVPDMNLPENQLPNGVTPFEWPFTNFPVISQLAEVGGPNLQNFPVFSIPQNQMYPIDWNYLTTLLGILSTMQALPAAGGGMTIPQQLLPGQPMLPIIVAQMGPQGAVLSSEEMSPSQFFTGLLIPGMQGALLPSGQAEPPPEGGEELLPAGQAGSNPEGTAAGIQKVFPTTTDGLSEIPDELYPTPSGFRQPDVGTSGMFIQPTVDISMEPSELREPPTSLVKLDMGNMQSPHNLSQPLVRGDSHILVNTVASKPLNVP